MSHTTVRQIYSLPNLYICVNILYYYLYIVGMCYSANMLYSYFFPNVQLLGFLYSHRFKTPKHSVSIRVVIDCKKKVIEMFLPRGLYSEVDNNASKVVVFKSIKYTIYLRHTKCRNKTVNRRILTIRSVLIRY